MGSNNNISSENSCKQRLMRCACISAAVHTKFGGHGLSGFRVKAPFVFIQKWLFGPWTIVHGIGGQKIESAQKIHASRGWCELHANQFWWAWPLWFQRFCSFMFFSNFQFPFQTMDMWSKIEAAQNVTKGMVMPIDLDFNLHMNNSKYLRELDLYVDQGLREILIRGAVFLVNAISIRYRHSLQLFQKIEV